MLKQSFRNKLDTMAHTSNTYNKITYRRWNDRSRRTKIVRIRYRLVFSKSTDSTFDSINDESFIAKYIRYDGTYIGHMEQNPLPWVKQPRAVKKLSVSDLDSYFLIRTTRPSVIECWIIHSEIHEIRWHIGRKHATTTLTVGETNARDVSYLVRIGYQNWNRKTIDWSIRSMKIPSLTIALDLIAQKMNRYN